MIEIKMCDGDILYIAKSDINRIHIYSETSKVEVVLKNGDYLKEWFDTIKEVSDINIDNREFKRLTISEFADKLK